MTTEILKSSKGGQPLLQDGKLRKDLEDQVFEFTKDLIVWGSPRVIKSYYNFRDTQNTDVHIIVKLDEMLREIRRDLGNSNRGIKKGDLIKLFITDPEKMDEFL